MRSIKDEPKSSHSRAELSRKMLEDPLTALKQKEDEQKRLLFQKLQLKQAGGVNVKIYKLVLFCSLALMS